MPELPEVELLGRGLSRYISDSTITAVEVITPKVTRSDLKQVIGGRVIGVRRFGKMLCIDLSNAFSLAIHLKMTGRLIYRGKKQPAHLKVDEDLTTLPGKHTHVVFTFRGGDKLYFNDIRRFGWVQAVKTSEVNRLPFVAKLGPEPGKTLNAQQFEAILRKIGRPVKLLLMDQERISGVGNIYANESLFCAKIRPDRKARQLASSEAKVLFECTLRVFEEGMKYGGSSTNAYRDVLGRKGQYQEHYMVYDREGKRCLREGCSGTIKKTMMGGRGTYFCTTCQR